MSARASRQGSVSFVTVIAGVTFLVVGAVLLTLVVFPLSNAFTGAAFWSADTTSGSNVLDVVGGLWRFWSFIMLTALTVFIWVTTRQ